MTKNVLKKILMLAISALFACCATSAEIKALSAEPNFGRDGSKQKQKQVLAVLELAALGRANLPYICLKSAL
ncbi:hypothetical protein [Campylobacter concisus]|uniref:hypothetical protein n=1 Tax=Campylobacter concisus TaxID=199 RepID=UPI000CD8F6DD|nr:hypothetical protein [Campylobacter concisus]